MGRHLVQIVATSGDPSSIGPEVASAALSRFLQKHPHVQVKMLGALYKPEKLFRYIHRGQLIWEKWPLKTFKLGSPSIAGARFALECLSLAAKSALDNKDSALVTGPVDKFWSSKVLRGFSGQTGFLEHLCRAPSSTMMLKGPDLCVGLVTQHIPLKKVSSSLTAKKIITTARHVHQYWKPLVKNPRLALAGLNPHASDQGLIGNEEKKLLLPTVKKLQQEMNIVGPLSPDSMFAHRSRYDAVIALYHDQGLIPLKVLNFYSAVNITLGLPFLRISVDHGTAFDIAGRDKASYESYEQALEHSYQWIKRSSIDDKSHGRQSS